MTTRTMLLLGGAALAAALAFPVAHAQAPTPAATPRVEFPSGVELVTVDAVVTDDKGRPVAGLTRGDFTLSEDGQPKDIVEFEPVEVGGAPALPEEADIAPPRPAVSSNAAAAAPVARTFVIAFDDLHLTVQQGERAKKAAKRFLETSLHEGDQVELVSTGGDARWSTEAGVGRADVVKILDRLQGHAPSDLAPDHLSDWEAMMIYTHRDAQVLAVVSRRWAEMGALPDIPFSDSQSQQQLGNLREGSPLIVTKAQQVYSDVKSRNQRTMRQLIRVMQGLAPLKGRKSVVLLSAGFVQDPQVLEYRDLVAAARRANAAIYFVDPRTANETTNALQDAETGPIPQEGDTGLLIDEARMDAEGAVSATLDTGGFVIANAAALDQGLRRLSDESRVYYLLGYRPTAKNDGKFHKIDVKVARPGVTVRARRGYYAQTVAKVESTDADTKQLAADVRQALETPGESADIPLRLTAYVLGPAEAGKPAKGEKAVVGAVAVDLLGELDLRGLKLEERGGRFAGAVDYYVIVSGRDTAFRAADQQHLDLSLDETRRTEFTARGLPLLRQFKLAPGAYQARLVARDRSTGKVGTVRHDFDVPGPGLRLTSPILTDALDQSGGTPRPLLVAHRVFASGRTLIASFEVVGARTPAKVVSGFTLSGPGGRVVARMDPTAIAPTPDGHLARTLRLPVLNDPGAYTLTLTVRDQTAGEGVTREEPFTIAAPVKTLVEHARLVAPMDDARTRLADGWVLVDDRRIEAVGSGEPPPGHVDRRLDARGKVVLPGFVNTHHHLPQVLTRNVPRVQEAPLFRWLVELYEVWRGYDAEAVDIAARVGLGELLLTGCTASTDHLYLFPAGQEKLIDIEVAAARDLGIRSHFTRGSMSRGRSQGGLPPDDVVQGEEAILADSRRLIREHHDARPGAMTRIALAPCSPFSVTDELMRRTADLAREQGVRLHTHLAETRDEDRYCLEQYGCRPTEYVRRLGWLGPDVWMAHCVCLDADEVQLFAETGTSVAHCPSSNFRLGSGIAPVRAMVKAGVGVGLGVDGSASNDTSNMMAEVRQAMLAHRLDCDPSQWLTAEDVLWMATRGGARCLGRDDIGSLEPGRCADLILIDTRRLSYAGAGSDILAALVFSPFPEPVDTVMVDGRIVVEGGELVGVDVERLIARADAAAEGLLDRASRTTGTNYRAR